MLPPPPLIYIKNKQAFLKQIFFFKLSHFLVICPFPIARLKYFSSQDWNISHLRSEIFPISKLKYFPSQNWNISHLRAEIFLLNSQYWWNCVFSDFIEKLEKTEVSKEETGSSCPICLKGYEAGEAISSLPCKHSFHVNCLLPWLQVNLCKPLAHSGWFYRVPKRKRPVCRIYLNIYV